jgi:hypothetical protein
MKKQTGTPEILKNLMLINLIKTIQERIRPIGLMNTTVIVT